MPTPYAIHVRKGHELVDMAHELIQDDKMHLVDLRKSSLVYFLIGGLTGKAADEFGRVEKKSNTDALAYRDMLGLGRIQDTEEPMRGAGRSQEDAFFVWASVASFAAGSPCDLDDTIFLVKINKRWWEALALDKTQGVKLQRQKLHALLCSIVPSESGGTIAKPDLKFHTEQLLAFGPELDDLKQVNKLLERYDGGGQEQLPLDEEAPAEEGQAPQVLGLPSMLLGLPAYPPVGKDLPLLEATPLVIASKEEEEILEGEILAVDGEPVGDAPTSKEDLEQELRGLLAPSVLSEEPRISESSGTISSRCSTLDELVIDFLEVQTSQMLGHWDFALAAARAGLGHLIARQWTGQKSTWTRSRELACTIIGHHHADFTKAIELLPAFAKHVLDAATPKNPKAGLKSWVVPTAKVDEKLPHAGESSTEADSPSQNAPLEVDENMPASGEGSPEPFKGPTWSATRKAFVDAVIAAGMASYVSRDNMPSFVESGRLARTILYGHDAGPGRGPCLYGDDLFTAALRDLPLWLHHMEHDGLPTAKRSTAKKDAHRLPWMGSLLVKQVRQEEQEEVLGASSTSSLPLDIEPARSTLEQANDFAALLVGGGA